MGKSDQNLAPILYVEDDAGLARLLQKRLPRQSAVRVDLAADAEQGLTRLQNETYMLVLVDYQLPGMNGLEFLHALRHSKNETPVIMLTGAGNEEVAVAAMKLGAVDYLVKDAAGSYLELLPTIIQRIWNHQELLRGQRLARLRQQQANVVFEAAREAITITDELNNIEAINPAFTRITGYSFDEVVGKNPSVLQSGRHDAHFYEAMWADLLKNDFWQGDIWNRRKNGEIYPEWLSLSVIRDDAGEITQYVAIFNDITERKQDEEKVWHQANYDALTGLPNRSLFMDRAEQALHKAKRDSNSCALLFIDMDRLKTINDTLGHLCGDKALEEMGKCLRASIRKTDTVCRYAGDEFMVLLPGVQSADESETVAKNILRALSAPILLDGNSTQLSASIGIAVFPQDGEDIESLLNRADTAMYQSKNSGGHRYTICSG